MNGQDGQPANKRVRIHGGSGGSGGGSNASSVGMYSLFRNNRFALNEMFQRSASKFAIFYV